MGELMRKIYMLVDGRAAPDAPQLFARHHSDCTVYSVADDLDEAIADRAGFADAVLVECAVLEQDADGNPTKVDEGKVIPWP